MAIDRLVVIGSSAGGLESLRTLIGSLPRDFGAPICVVNHTAPESPGVLDQVLSRAGDLSASMVRSGDRLRPGHVHVAPPDHHLLVEPGVLCLSRGPRENRFRPAIDPLFRSAAQVYGPRVIGIVLTGHLDDGAAGLWTIRQLGGVAVVEDPGTALCSGMPANALRRVPDAHVAPLDQLGAVLQHLMARSVHDTPSLPPRQLEIEVRIAKDEPPLPAGLLTLGAPSLHTCPECHGVLIAVQEGDHVRFRCHTGHAYSANSLLAAVSDGVDAALANAERALQEAALLARRLSDDPDVPVDGERLTHLRARAEAATRQAQVIRDLLLEHAAQPPSRPVEEAP